MLPTRSASGSLFMAGVDGGGQVFEVASFGVAVFIVSFAACTDLDIPSFADALPSAEGWFSFSALLSLVASTVGAPSMNWKALSLVLV
jgi:hypothetical protein